MTKKILDTTKNSPIFLYGKIKGLNNRESARFFALFKDDADFTNTTQTNSASIAGYIELCREPNVIIPVEASSVNTPEGIVTNVVPVASRSKLVMAYEKQRKAYLKIKQIRETKTEQVNQLFEALHPFRVQIPSGMTYRQNALQHILRFIN
jgi:hypothetical protein